MRKAIIILLVVFGFLTDHVMADERQNGNGTVGVRVHILNSPRQKAATRIRVLLPDNFDDNKRYRVLYLLPVEAGAATGYGDGMDEAQRRDLHNRFDVICVAPDFADLPWYADHPTDMKIQQEAYFIKEVLPTVDQNYPVLDGRKGRLLVGFSKSGWGAFSLLLRHPNLFEKAGAWDAPLMKDAPNQFGMGPIFGTQKNFDGYHLTELLKDATEKLGEDPRLIHVGYGNFHDHHREFEELLTGEKIPHVYRDGPQRKHTWGSGWLEQVVDLMLADDDASGDG